MKNNGEVVGVAVKFGWLGYWGSECWVAWGKGIKKPFGYDPERFLSVAGERYRV